MNRPSTETRASAAGLGAPGSQTLARGLNALQLIASSPNGMSVSQVADDIGVHRTIAYRLLSTLAQFRFVTKGDDGRYRPAAALAVLGVNMLNTLRVIRFAIFLMTYSMIAELVSVHLDRFLDSYSYG